MATLAHTDAKTSARVLVVTDVRLFREGIARILAEKAPHLKVETATADERLATVLPVFPPDVLLIESVAVRRGDAIELARSATPAVRVVAFAVAEEEEEVIACAQAQVAGFVSRDALPEDLVFAVESALRGKLWCSARIAALMCARLASAARHFDQRHGVLTVREREILNLLDDELPNKVIAQRLRIEVSTVKHHVHNILEKLQVKHRWQAPAAARLKPAVDTSAVGTRPSI